jgi:ssDNA-specific exonuclease RecJ
VNVESQPSATDIAEAVLEKLKVLPFEQQAAVLDFAEFLAQKHIQREDIVNRPIWEKIREIAKQVPEEEWDRLPVDGAEQHDHYLYGVPKREV